MKKFVFVYYGATGVPEGMNMEDVMKEWGAWFEEMGGALVDPGNPFNDDGQRVSQSGVEAIGADNHPSTGYTIVNAENMNAATEMAKGCPMHAHTKGEGSVRVYDAMPM